MTIPLRDRLEVDFQTALGGAGYALGLEDVEFTFLTNSANITAEQWRSNFGFINTLAGITLANDCIDGVRFLDCSGIADNTAITITLGALTATFTKTADNKAVGIMKAGNNISVLNVGSGNTTNETDTIPTYDSTTQYTNGNLVRYGSEVFFRSSSVVTIGGAYPNVNQGWVKLDNQITNYDADTHYTSGSLVNHNSDVWLAIDTPPINTTPTEGTHWHKLTGRLSAIATDNTLTGDGTSGDPLKVANPFTQAEKTKLGNIEDSATADMTNAEVKTAYEANANTNVYTDGEKTKLGNIEDSATADMTNAEIKTAYEANANTNAYTDGEKTKLQGIEAGAEVNPPLANHDELTNANSNNIRGYTTSQLATFVETHQLHNAPVFTTSVHQTYYVGDFVRYTDPNHNQLDVYILVEALDDTERNNTPNVEPKWKRINTDLIDWRGVVFNRGSVVLHNNAIWMAVGDTAAANEPGSSAVWARISNEGLAFTQADHDKLDGIEDNATADLTAAEIKTLYEGNVNTNALTNSNLAKLNAIEDNATADQTADELRASIGSLSVDEITNDDTTPKLVTGERLNALNTSGTAPQATVLEITEGTEPELRSYSPQRFHAGVDAIVGGEGYLTAINHDTSLTGEGNGNSALGVNATEVRNRLGQLDATEIADGNSVLAELISASVLKTAIETHGGDNLYQGDWVANTAYTPAQIVKSHESLYVAQKDIPANLEAPHFHTDTEYWSPLVEVQAWPEAGSGDSITLTKFQMVEHANRVYLFNGNQPETYNDTQTPADPLLGALFHLIGLPARVTDDEITAGTDLNPHSYSPRDIVKFIDTHAEGEYPQGFAEPVRTQLHSSNVNITANRTWVGTGYVLTHTDGELIFTFQIHVQNTDFDHALPVVAIKRVLIDDFLALTPTIAGSLLSSIAPENAHVGLLVGAATSTQEQEFFIGRTALNEILITSSSVSVDAYPLTIDHLQYKAVAPVGGGLSTTKLFEEDIAMPLLDTFYQVPNSSNWTTYDMLEIHYNASHGSDTDNNQTTTVQLFRTQTIKDLAAATAGAIGNKEYLSMVIARDNSNTDPLTHGFVSVAIARDSDNNLLIAKSAGSASTDLPEPLIGYGITFNAGLGKANITDALLQAGTSTETGPVSPALLVNNLEEKRLIRNDNTFHISNTANRGRILTPFGNAEYINNTPGANYVWAEHDEVRFVFHFDYDTSLTQHENRIHDRHESVMETPFIRVYRIAEMRPLYRVADPTLPATINAQGTTTFVRTDGSLNMQGTRVNSTWRLGISKLLNRGWYFGRTWLPHVNENADTAQSTCVDTYMTKLDMDTYSQFGFLFIPYQVDNPSTIRHPYQLEATHNSLRNDIVITRMEMWGYRHGYKRIVHDVTRAAGLSQ